MRKNTVKKMVTALVLSAISLSAVAAGNINAGKALAEKYNCATCHGKDLNSPIDPSYPKLAGQHKDYLEHALTAYKRNDGPNGRNNAIMVGQVQPLSNQDIKDLAAYLHSLPTALVVHR
ncbi:cytochrome c family protein [Janthinobacterium agaricidamnosum NBRC 102515 = DSM 9628]|uniref:Cytochrome c family protein n=2 Tax=Janthinobacterium agaricidamnosum TaxID=55508 RepID=W0V0G8_9BURK|nr:cytochrome c family protein [Janthinobacterium agaricidamnosum NBRC 102515 = DSM 9628]